MLSAGETVVIEFDFEKKKNTEFGIWKLSSLQIGELKTYI